MRKKLVFVLCVVLQTVTGCTCNPANRNFGVYESTYRHTSSHPVTFTVLNILPSRQARSDDAYGELYRKPEDRPEYNEVYVFEDSEACQAAATGCPIAWKALTTQAQSPWKITYGKEGESLKTVEGPKELEPSKRYQLLVGVRESGCLRQVGWLEFRISQEGELFPLEFQSEERDWMTEGYRPPPAAKTDEHTQDRLNRLAKQYEKLNGHPLLPLSYGEEVPAEKPDR